MNEAFRLAPHEWAMLRTLLDEALSKPAGARAAWLDSLSDAPAVALVPRLRALLANAADAAEASGGAPATAARLLETLPKVETGQFAPAPGAGERAGDAVGPYRLLRELGSGGMGSVWLAERTDMLQGRQVALKLPHGAWKRAGLAERLAREREILATLEHPNIARLYDAGVTPQGQPWLALEYVAGERIDMHCRARQLDVGSRLRLFLQVARAVAHAHAQLVVHRDLKPANMLVTPTGDVKLLDFGIAKLAAEGVVAETELTREAGRAYTPEYASPEQVLGRPIGTASDVYSLGVVLFELLADARPYRLEPARQPARAALEQAVSQGDLPRPSALAPPARRAAIRGDLDTIVLKALKREPAERYATVAALAEDVQRHLERRPVLAQPDRAWYRVRTFVRRNRLAVSAGAAVGLALAAGLVVALWQAHVARGEQRRAEAVKGFVAGLLADADPFNTTSRAPTVEGLLQRAEERLRGPLPGGAATRIELLEMLGASYVGLSRFERAEQVLAQAIDEGRGGLGADHPLTQKARITMLAVHRFRGRTAEMKAELDVLLPVLRGARTGPGENLQRALTAAAHLALDSGQYVQATAVAREALQLAVQLRGENDPVAGDAALLLASTGQFGGDAEATLTLAVEARERLLRIHGGERPHARVLDARFMVGRALGNVGRYAEAVDELRHVLQQVRELLGAEANMAAFVAADIARFELELMRPAAAEAMAALARRIAERDAAEDSYTVAAARWTHGRALLALARHEEAREQLARALAWMQRERGAGHPLTLDIAASHATSLARLGRLDAAWSELAPRLAAYRAARPVPRYRGLHAAGLVRALQGRTEEAMALQQEALAALPDTPLHRPRRDAARAELAQLALARGDAREAMAELQRLQRAPGEGGADGPEEAGRLATLGQAHIALGQAAEGRQAMLRAARLLEAGTVR
ncbi:MAG: protein kinase [Rubrivivax sp.]|nr:protein kinase [Rubrivivax sp.]